MLTHHWNRSTVTLFLRLIQQGRSRGFTLIDVIVAILVMSLFTSAAMSGLSLATLFKIRARVSTEATNWIQQDLEAVRSQSNQISYVLATNAAAGQPYITLFSVAGLAANEQITIGSSSMVYVIHSISGNTVRLTSNLTINQAVETRVLTISKCDATVPQAGFASVLQQTLPALPDGGSRTIAGKTYTLTRNVSISAALPHDVLQLSYVVRSAGSTTPITTMYTEVIPNVAFQCPRAQ